MSEDSFGKATFVNVFKEVLKEMGRVCDLHIYMAFEGTEQCEIVRYHHSITVPGTSIVNSSLAVDSGSVLKCMGSGSDRHDCL
jgi:hypothetical protein